MKARLCAPLVGLALACAQQDDDVTAASLQLDVPGSIASALDGTGVRFSAELFIVRAPCPPPTQETTGDVLAYDIADVAPGAPVAFNVYIPVWQLLAPSRLGALYCTRVQYTMFFLDETSTESLPAGYQQSVADFAIRPYVPVPVQLGAFVGDGPDTPLEHYDQDGDRIPNLVEVQLGLSPHATDTMEGELGVRRLDAVDFLFGSSDSDALVYEGPATLQHVGALDVDRTEATNRQYRVCMGTVSADGSRFECSEPEKAQFDGRLLRVMNAAEARAPVVGITHHQAAEFCRARGMRLPTEVEWERAARVRGNDPNDLSIYPWGNDPPVLDVNSQNGCTLGRFTLYREEDLFPRYCPDRPFETAPIDAGAPSTRLGFNELYDLAGNAAEWTADNYHEDLHELLASGTAPPYVDTNSRAFTVRGGSFWSGPRFVRGTSRSVVDEASATASVLAAVGVRCVKDAQ